MKISLFFISFTLFNKEKAILSPKMNEKLYNYRGKISVMADENQGPVMPRLTK
uniref:Uncharacterized protein n=1 Tax=Rhizophora mucronata TaxID=61149 RepID=A0A2P2IJT9_RHIMU